MTKQELFKKYHINETHNAWDGTDSWMRVGIHRLMHDGKLPESGDMSVKYITEFLDKTEDMTYMKELMKRKDWPSLYLTAKRMIYTLSEQILNEQ